MLSNQNILTNYIKYNFKLYLKFKFSKYNSKLSKKIMNQVPSTLFLYNKNLFVYNLVFFLLYNNIFIELFLKKNDKIHSWKISKIINFYIFLNKNLIKNIMLHFYKIFIYMKNLFVKKYLMLKKETNHYITNMKFYTKILRIKKYSFFVNYIYNPLYFLKTFLIQKIYLKYIFI